MKIEKTLPTAIYDSTIQWIEHTKKEITDDSYATDFDLSNGTPSIELTIGYNPKNLTFAFQTGPMEFYGDVYHYPCWSTATIYRNSDPYAVIGPMLVALENDAVEWLMHNVNQ